MSDDSNAQRPWWRRALAFLWLWTYRIVGTIIILCALLIVFAQTNLFRGWVRDIALNALNDALLGQVVVDDIHIDIFRGIVLTRPRLYAHGTTVLDAEELVLKYDLAPLLQNIIVINEITFKKPHIYIQRTKGDSVWNVERIVKPTTDTTTSALPDFKVIVRLLQITGGTVYVNDMNEEWGDSRYFDPTHLSIGNVELRASARAELKAEDFTVAINRFGYTNAHSPFAVKDLVTSIRLWHGGISMPTLSLKTNESDIGVRAELANVDVFKNFSLDSLRKHPIEGYIEANRIWGQEITYFIPDLDIRDGYNLKSYSTYDGRDLVLDDLEVHADRTELFGKLKIMYIDGSRPLFLDGTLVNSTAVYADMRRRLPFIPMPELPFITQTRIERLHMRGPPEDSLWFDLHVADKPGRIDGEMSLYLKNEEIGYKADLTVKNGQLKVFLPDSSKLDTDLNGRLTIQGRGFELNTMQGSVNLLLDRSTVSGYVVRKTALIASADGAGNIKIDTLDLELPATNRDSVDTTIDVSATQTLAASGTLHAQDLDHPKYELKISTRALDLAGILGEATLPHRITADLTIDAQGFELDSLLGTVEGRVKEFALADRALLPFDLKLVSRLDSNVGRYLELSSSFASITASGRFVPSALFTSMGAAVTAMTDIVSARLQYFADSSHKVSPLSEPLTPVDVRFVATVSDPVPMSAFLPEDMTMAGSVKIVGHLAAGTDTMYMDIDTARIQDLLVESDSLKIQSDPLEFRLNVRLRDMLVAPKVTAIDLSAKGDSAVIINDLHLMKPSITMSLGLDTGSIVAQSDINKMAAYLRAKVGFAPERATIAIDSAAFVVDTNNRLAWHTKEPSVIAVDKGVYTIKGLKIVRDSSEAINVNGRMSLTRFDSMHVDVENFELSDVSRFVQVADDNPLYFLNGTITSAAVKINGTWKEPDVDVKVEAREIAYNEALIGDLKAEIKHHNRMVTGFATIDNDELAQDTTRTLDVRINSLPLDMGLTDVKERLVSGKPVDIQLVANKLSLAAAEPFLPAVERVRGKADAKVSLMGTADKMEFTGNARFFKTSFRTQATNVYYVADGAVSLQGEKLIIDTVVIRNVPRDYRSRVAGVAYASGSLQFDGLTPKTLDFTVRTPGLTVMNAASAAKSPTVYGDLAIATGPSSPIHLYGSLDAPTLEGDIHVLYGNLTMPEDRSATKKRATSFDYVTRRDSTRDKYRSVFTLVRPIAVYRPQIEVRKQELADSLSRDSLSNSLVVLPDDSTKVDTTITTFVKKTIGGMADNMLFRLNIWFDGLTLVTMEIGSFETLVADVGMDSRRQPLRFTGRFIDNSINLAGKLKVLEGESEYFFLKTFKASGLLDFDRGGMANPALNLTAKYTGSRQLGSGGNSEEFQVVIDITGTKNQPHLAFRIFMNGREQTGDSTKITADAITLILFGRTQAELSTSGQGGIGSNTIGDATSIATNSAVSQVLNDILGNSAMIRSVAFEQAADGSGNRIQITGQLFGDVSYKFNGNVSDVGGNNTFTVSIPLTVFGDAEALKYFIFEFGRSITNQSGNVTRNDRAWEVKLGAHLP